MHDGSDGGPMIGTGASEEEDPFALGELVAALRHPVDFGPEVDGAVMSAIRLAPAPLVVVPGGARQTRVAARAAARDDAPRRLATTPTAPRAWHWLTRSRSVRVSPLGALAAAGIAIAAVFGLRRDADRRPESLGRGPDTLPSITGEFAAVPAAGGTTASRVATAAASPQPSSAAVARDTVFLTRFLIVVPGAKRVALVGDFNDWDHQATPLAHVASNGVWTVEVPLTPGRYTYAFLVDGQRWVADPDAPRAIGDDFGRPSSVVTVQPGSV